MNLKTEHITISRKDIHIKETNESIWFWYCHTQNFVKSGLRAPCYAREHNINYAKLRNMMSNIIYCKDSHPERYKEMVALAYAYLDSDIPRQQFCDKINMPVQRFARAVLHVKYLQRIREIENSGRSLSDINVMQVPADAIWVPIKRKSKRRRNYLQVVPSYAAHNASNEDRNMTILEPKKAPSSIGIIEIDEKNNIEISGNNGIKVSLSSSADPVKIVKMIQLLREL